MGKYRLARYFSKRLLSLHLAPSSLNVASPASGLISESVPGFVLGAQDPIQRFANQLVCEFIAIIQCCWQPILQECLYRTPGSTLALDLAHQGHVGLKSFDG